jgi:hypothetical protein
MVDDFLASLEIDNIGSGSASDATLDAIKATLQRERKEYELRADQMRRVILVGEEDALSEESNEDQGEKLVPQHLTSIAPTQTHQTSRLQALTDTLLEHILIFLVFKRNCLEMLLFLVSNPNY